MDRTACAWLIRRFIDPAAEFHFVEDVADVASDATPFDIAGYPFSHHGGDSTFEVMIRHYAIDVPGVQALAQIVHQADLEDDRYDVPEAAGVDAVIRGLGRLLGADDRLIEASLSIYDGLLLELQSAHR